MGPIKIIVSRTLSPLPSRLGYLLPVSDYQLIKVGTLYGKILFKYLAKPNQSIVIEQRLCL
jgi:hypothetical protein